MYMLVVCRHYEDDKGCSIVCMKNDFGVKGGGYSVLQI